MPNQSDMKILKLLPDDVTEIKYENNIKANDLLIWKNELHKYGIDKEVIIFVGDALFSMLMRCVMDAWMSQVKPEMVNPLRLRNGTEYIGVNLWENGTVCFTIHAYLNEN